jgi:glycosyltransferase involved in cell wall biosynthesis
MWMLPPEITIVTPCLNPGKTLPLCCASVHDQKEVRVEHVVIDGGSTDGTVEWLRHQSGIKWISEPDDGMYDAVNKGLRMASATIVAYLNSDEQYLPDALRQVVREIGEPTLDVLFADTVIVDVDGRYVCSRQSLTPHYYHTMLCELGTLTASTFFRRDILTRFDAWFDPTWRAAGDADWMLTLLRKDAHMRVMRSYTSCFTDHGQNLALSKTAESEMQRLKHLAPGWAVKLKWVWRTFHRLRRLANGLYAPKPFAYDIYTVDSPGMRQRVDVQSPTFLWKSRLKG